MTGDELEEEVMKGKPITYFMKNHLQKAWQLAGEKSVKEDEEPVIDIKSAPTIQFKRM